MPEVSGYGAPANVYQKPAESKAIEYDERPENSQSTGKLEGLKGVEVILSSEKAGPELETYEDLNRPAPKGLSAAEERALDDQLYQARKTDLDDPGPTEMTEREDRALDSML